MSFAKFKQNRAAGVGEFHNAVAHNRC